MGNHTTHLAFIATLSTLLIMGCGGGTSLEDVDPSELEATAGSTWIRSTGSGDTASTELLVVDVEDPSLWDGSLRRISRSTIGYARDTEVLLGVIGRGGEPGSGEVVFSQGWSYVLEPEVSVLNRRGADRILMEEPAAQTILFEMNGDLLEVTIDGQTLAYSSLQRMVEAIGSDPGFNSQEGAEAAARIAMLPVFTAQARIIGWGGAGLTQFFDIIVSFAPLAPGAASSSSYSVGILGSLMQPIYEVTFLDLQEQHGLVVNGVQARTLNLGGNGPFSGELDFAVNDRPDDPASLLVGTLDFTGLMAEGFYLSTGSAELTLEGNAFVIDADVLRFVDFSGYLPSP